MTNGSPGVPSGSKAYLTYSHRRRLPPALRSQFRDLDQLMRDMAGSASERLLLVAPYLSETGMEYLREGIAMSAARGAAIKLVTGDLTRDGVNYRALRALASGDTASAVRDRVRVLAPSGPIPLFVHAKLIVSDRCRGYLGSANLSGPAMAANFEVGLELSASQARSLDQLFVWLESDGTLIDRTSEVWV